MTYDPSSLDEYEYDGFKLLISEAALSAAERLLGEHFEEAEETGEDRTGTLFCGCEVCSGRITAGFWIAWAARALQNGTAAYLEPAPALTNTTPDDPSYYDE